MSRLSLESLETRETPSAGVGGYNDDLIGWNFESGAAAHVRHRMFAIVDRTQAASDGYAGTHVLYQDITIPAAAGDSYYGTGVYKSVDSGRAW